MSETKTSTYWCNENLPVRDIDEKENWCNLSANRLYNKLSKVNNNTWRKNDWRNILVNKRIYCSRSSLKRTSIFR